MRNCTVQRLVCRRRGSQATLHVNISGHSRLGESSFNSSGESEEGETGSFCPHLTEGTTSAAEWIGITTNSEECSYSSDMDDIPLSSDINDHPFPWEFQMVCNFFQNYCILLTNVLFAKF